MEQDKKFYSTREMATETGYSVSWIADLIKKLGLKAEVFQRGESGGLYEFILPREEAKKLLAYAKKRKNIEEERKKV